MAKMSFLKNLLQELSLDRALRQILDEPYLKDVSARLKGSDAVQEIMEKLDKDEGIFGWMDYSQLMDTRENILPDMLIKYSELEQPKFSETSVGETFDEQFESIFGKKKFGKGGLEAPEYFGDIANPIWVQGRWWDFDQLDEEQKKYWREADRLKHGKDYGGDYIPFPDRHYWNPETGDYQELPVTEEQWADEPHILKQRREHKEVAPFGYDKAKTWKELGKQLGPDELAWWESYLKGNVPGVHGVVTPGTYETVFGPMEDYFKNVEEWRAQTGRPERWYTEMGAGMGVGVPVGMASAYGIGALLRKFGNPKIAKIIAEAFPLTMSKKGPFSLANWKKSLIRNPWELAKLHWKDWRKGVPGQLLKTIAPKAATRVGASWWGGPIGWGAAGALTAWDLYRLIKGGADSSVEEDTIELMAEEMQ